MTMTRTMLLYLLVAVLAACSDDNSSGEQDTPWQVSTDSATLMLFSEGQLVSVEPQDRLAAVQKGMSLELYDLSSLDSPALLSSIDSDAAILEALLDHGRLFVVTEDGYLSYYDVQAPHNPVLVSRIEVGVFVPHEFADARFDHLPKMLTADTDRLFVSLHDKVILLTIDEPGQLHIVAELPFDYASTSVSGTLLFVVSNEFAGRCINFEDPPEPCDYPIPASISSLHILDISVPDEPVEIQEAIEPNLDIRFSTSLQQYSPPLTSEDGFYLCESKPPLPESRGVYHYRRNTFGNFEIEQRIMLTMGFAFGRLPLENTVFCQLSNGFVVYLKLGSFSPAKVGFIAIDLSDPSDRTEVLDFVTVAELGVSSDLDYASLRAYEHPVVIFDTNAGSFAVDIVKLKELQSPSETL